MPVGHVGAFWLVGGWRFQHDQKPTVSSILLPALRGGAFWTRIYQYPSPEVSRNQFLGVVKIYQKFKGMIREVAYYRLRYHLKEN
jgi:hypothetical protein